MVSIGIVGFGNMGSAHAKCIAQGEVAGMQLCAVCDIDAQKRRAAKTLYPEVAVFEDYREMLSSNLDAVLIATPHYLHAPIAVDAFAAGLHVMSEKPAGVYLRQAKEMIAAAQASGKVFGIMFNQRTNPLFQKARQIVKSGELGEIKRFSWVVTNWYRTQHYYDSGDWRATWRGEGGGVLLNQAPHNLDIWQWICGMPKRMRAFVRTGHYHDISVEDDVTIYAEYENGASATFITTTGEYPGTNRLEIAGTLGKIVVEAGNLTWYQLPMDERRLCVESAENFPNLDVEVKTFSDLGEGGAHREILQNFQSAIVSGTPLLAAGEEGALELAISNAAYLSAELDDWVDLPCNDEEFEAFLQKKMQSEKEKTKQNSAASRDMSRGYDPRWSVRW